MDILIGAIGQGIFIFIITIIFPILYFAAEIIGCLVFALLKKILKRNFEIKKVTKNYFFSLKFRLAVVLIVCIILSLISNWNYNRIMSNPSHNKLMYIDKMGAIFSDRNNEDNGLFPILQSINWIALPVLYILNIINTMINRHRYGRDEKLINYFLFVLSGIILASMCYLSGNIMMGV